jgi:hypothetical protein
MFTRFRYMTPAEIALYYNKLGVDIDPKKSLMQKIMSRHSTARIIVLHVMIFRTNVLQCRDST